MMTLLSDPALRRIGMMLLGAALLVRSYLQARREAEKREDIVVDGWVTRWSDDPEAYRLEHREVSRGYFYAIGWGVVFVSLEFLTWWLQ